MLDTISELLTQIGAPGAFATRHTVVSGDLNLEVEGVGRIRLPVTAGTARKLCEVARPARHGFKDQTRLDTRVRDTWEIPRSRISIDQSRWKKTLLPQLERIRCDLGLPEGCRLKAELHNLLVYAPGQFFAAHQDSEKKDGMVGTLVVSLPSQFTGGAMVIEHHEEKLSVGGSSDKLTFIAFYADCHHEVRPIKQGHRIVLTYNLIVEGDVVPAGAPADRIGKLAGSLRDFFETSRTPRWQGERGCEPPDRLVCLLDHQYTQSGLGWKRLKNGDAVRVASLREAARQLDCEIFLALADVHETWGCEDDDSGYGGRYGYRSRWSYDDEDEEDKPGGKSSEPELTDLIDSDVELRHWIGEDGRTKAVRTGVGAGELCYTKPSVDLEPFRSEHEGYMGNYGNTVDRWYHRAAVVLWPRERTFVIRAKASARWGIDEVGKSLKKGNSAQALALAQRLLPFWKNIAGREENSVVFDKTLQVAAQLDNPQVAATLLQPFKLVQLKAAAAQRLVDLLDRYGPQWCGALLKQWDAERNHEPSQVRLSWMGSALASICRKLCARNSPEAQALAQWVLAEQWARLLKQTKQIQAHTSVKEMARELGKLSRPVLRLIESSLAAKHPGLQGEIVGFLTANAASHPVSVSIGLLRTAHADYKRDALRSLGLKPVHERCTQDLTARLEAPARAGDDWSIATPIRCSCQLCATLTRYLRAPGTVRLEWPLAEARRAHVHGIVDSHDLPVTHTTLRKGSPYTLVLQKTDAVFKSDAAERHSWQDGLKWLTKTVAAF